MGIKAEIIAREIIKPSSPTSPHLRSYKFSAMDQPIPPVYLSVVLFYAAKDSSNTVGGGGNGDGKGDCGNGGCGENASKISERLKGSLSEVLARFYPVAGRIKDHIFVDCNDEGVDYLEAQINCPLADVLEEPRMEAMKHFTLPTELMVTGNDPMLRVQASFFMCGGMAIGVKMCHKIGDAISLSTFIKGWASTALGLPNSVVPDFSAASRFPPLDPFPGLPVDPSRWNQNGIARRFVFEASKIDALKAKVASTDVQNPTRVEVVSALLFKCVQSASLLGSPRPSVLVGGVNVRASLVPSLPAYTFGNIVGLLQVMGSKSDIGLQGTVCRLRKAISEGRDRFVHVAMKSSSVSVGDMPHKPDVTKVYAYSSWCRMPLYEADFGWGKPTWVCFGALLPDSIRLIDTREGDGIEAWVKLTEGEMALLERDQELSAFASLNPSALP